MAGNKRLIQVVTWTLVAAMALTGLLIGLGPSRPAPPPPVAAPPAGSGTVAAVAPAPAAPAPAVSALVRVDVPEGLGGAGAPVVVALHGRGDSARAFAGLAGRFAVDDHGATVLGWRALQGPRRFGDGASFFDGDRHRPEGLDASVAAVAAELTALRREGRKVALFGFSQGCMVIAHLALTAPQAIDAAVCIGGAALGTLPAPPPGVALPKVLVVAGANDAVVPLQEQQALMVALESRGVAVERIEHPGGHTIPQQVVAPVRRWLHSQLGLEVGAAAR